MGRATGSPVSQTGLNFDQFYTDIMIGGTPGYVEAKAIFYRHN